MLGSEYTTAQDDRIFTLTKDTASLYVAEIRMSQYIFPSVSYEQQVIWKGKVWSFGGQGQRGKIMRNVAFESFIFHFKKKENLLTIKMKLYQSGRY